MLRYVSKKLFSDKQKLEEAKKRAMKKFEEMLNQQNQQNMIKNRELEDSLKNLGNKDSENSSNHEAEAKSLRKSKKEANQNYEKKVQEILASYKMVNNTTEKTSFASDSQYSKIDNGTLNYRLRRSKISSETLENSAWLNIYENKINEKFEKLKRYLFLVVKLLFLYESYQIIKNIYEKKIETTKLQNAGIFAAYAILLTVYGINKGFNRRVVEKISLNIQTGDTLKILMKNNNVGIIEAKIANLYSITSKRRNVHEIFYYKTLNKVDQLFLPKNALYDPLLIMNICHPQVKTVKFVE